MVVALVYAFDTCLDRIHLLKKYYTSKGFDVEIGIKCPVLGFRVIRNET